MYTPKLRIVQTIFAGIALVALTSGGMAWAGEKAAAGDPYPLATCPVSGEKLGSMGEAYDYVYAGQLVRFCCPGCIDDFNADPQGAMAKVSAASMGHGDHADGHMKQDGDHSGHHH